MNRRFRPAAWAGALVLSLLAAGVLRAQGQKAGDVGFAYGDLKEVTLRGRLISLQEEMARKYGARIAGAGPEQQWGLALPEGQIYSFLDTEQYRKLLGADLAGKAVEVRARHFPRSMLLEILAFQPTDAAALKRRFFCSVCTIYTEDFGPCACCGKEMELIKE